MLFARNGTAPAPRTLEALKPDANEKIIVTPDVIRNFYLSTVDYFAKRDDSVVCMNEKEILSKMPASEKTISFDIMVYLASNFSLILSLLILNYKDFRDVFATLLEDEIRFEDMSEAERAVERKNVEPTDLPAKTMMTIGETIFDEQSLAVLYYLAMNGFRVYENTNLYDAVEKIEPFYTEEHRRIVGVLLSDYVHIIRGCNHNKKFIPTIHAMIEDAKRFFDIEETA